MIEKITYQCSFCNRIFSNKDKCEEHEKQHKEPKEIREFKYEPGLNSPKTIIVEMNDNTLNEYKFYRKL